MIHSDENFNGTWPFKANFCNVAGFKQHYVDEGENDSDSDKEILVCLHGEPTWGYLYRKMIPELSKNYRVIVPDHMGFGKSETPQDRKYTLETHVANLELLIEELKVDDITFVAQDWGGPIAGAYALKNPDKVARFCLMNTLLGYSGPLPNTAKTPWFSWIEKQENSKTLGGILGELGSSLLSVMQILGLERLSNVNQNWIDAYSSPFSDRESCVGAIAFPLDIHYGYCREFIVRSLKLGTLSKIKEKPSMLVVGMKDRAIHPENAIADFEALWPSGPVNKLYQSGHFCQEDSPEVLIALIHQFIQMTPRKDK